MLKSAKEIYSTLEANLDIKIQSNNNIIRTLTSIEAENNWMLRMQEEDYNDCISTNPAIGEYEEMIKSIPAYGEIMQGMRVDMSTLINRFRNVHLSLFRKDVFDYSLLKIEKNSISYSGIEAKAIIFCEGYKVIDNPYFNYLPHHPAKGEVLIIKIPGFNPPKVWRDKLYLIPLGEEKYWVESGYEWDMENLGPTEKERSRMKSILDTTLKVPYEILEHRSGVRPSTLDRKPYIGQHPKFTQLYLFNGLGAKGASLGPYWSDHFVKYLVNDSKLDEAVDINRFN